jgi:hypothetical protein
MSRSGYYEDCCDETWSTIRWRGAVVAAIRGKRGQKLLRDLRDALEAMPEKRLIAKKLEADGEVCALGALGRARGIDMQTLDPEDSEHVAATFGVADALAREIVHINDDEWGPCSPEERWEWTHRWVCRQIKDKRP